MPKINKRFLQLVFWLGSIGLVLIVGILYFPQECDDLSFCGALYYTIRLFIMEHDLASFPKVWPLIFIYFFAPIVTVSAIGKAITYFFKLSPALRTKWMSDHVVICGIGRTGKLLAATLKKEGISVVGVDNGCVEDFEDWCSEYKIPIIFGDFHCQNILKKAGAKKARALIFAAGDDLENLEGAVGAYGWLQTYSGPYRLIWTHIANERLANTARSALRTQGKIGIRIFDTYRIAAANIIKKHLAGNGQDFDEIYILGFGKFGRDLMEAVVKDVETKIDPKIHVIDIKDRKNEVLSLARELNISDRTIFDQIDIQDMKLTGGDKKAFFLCTDDDIGNLTIALMLASKMDSGHIYVRMAKWPFAAIAEHLKQTNDVVFVNINELMIKGIKNLPGIFQSAKPKDLKRCR